MLPHRCDHGAGIAGDARDQSGFVYGAAVKFLNPGAGELRRIFARKLPFEQWRKRSVLRFLLLGERGEKAIGEKMDVRVVDGERAPGRVHLTNLGSRGLNGKTCDARG